MGNQSEVKVLSQSPDRGNLTPRWQGHVWREASEGREVALYTVLHREGVSERSRRCAWVQAKAKRRKAVLHRVSRSSATKPYFGRGAAVLATGSQ